MPNKRIAMRKIHEILRLRFEVGLSFRQISQCADISTGVIQKMLKRLEAAGISWPLPEGMSEPRLPGCDKQRLPADPYPVVHHPYGAQQPEIRVVEGLQSRHNRTEVSLSGPDRRSSPDGAGCIRERVGRHVSADQQKLVCALGKPQYVIQLSSRYSQG
ncbi:MAG: hypothetical protein H6R25_2128 [Proteobacteria bacterium]|nr:hypothetical protein [Pseudomonadota bacterium]